MFAAKNLVPAPNRVEEEKKGKSTMQIEKIWAMSRYYEELSHEFSKLADKLTHLAQELEEGERINEN